MDGGSHFWYDAGQLKRAYQTSMRWAGSAYLHGIEKTSIPMSSTFKVAFVRDHEFESTEPGWATCRGGLHARLKADERPKAGMAVRKAAEE